MDNFLHENLRLVYLEWVDTIGDPDNGWKMEDETDEFFDREDNIVRETGFLWYEDKDYVYLVGKYMPSLVETLSSHRTKIPKKWILKRQEFKYKPSRDFKREEEDDLEEKAVKAIKKALNKDEAPE
jgi:hypothetical protein